MIKRKYLLPNAVPYIFASGSSNVQEISEDMECDSTNVNIYKLEDIKIN